LLDKEREERKENNSHRWSLFHAITRQVKYFESRLSEKKIPQKTSNEPASWFEKQIRQNRVIVLNS